MANSVNLGIGARVPAFPHDDNRFRATLLVGAIVDASGTIVGYEALAGGSSGSILNSAVQVSNATPTLLFAANPGRKGFLISNRGPNAIYIGGSGVTTATGTAIPAGGTHENSNGYTGSLYAIADTAAQVSPLDTRILEYLQ